VLLMLFRGFWVHLIYFYCFLGSSLPWVFRMFDKCVRFEVLYFAGNFLGMVDGSMNLDDQSGELYLRHECYQQLWTKFFGRYVREETTMSLFVTESACCGVERVLIFN